MSWRGQTAPIQQVETPSSEKSAAPCGVCVRGNCAERTDAARDGVQRGFVHQGMCVPFWPAVLARRVLETSKRPTKVSRNGMHTKNPSLDFRLSHKARPHHQLVRDLVPVHVYNLEPRCTRHPEAQHRPTRPRTTGAAAVVWSQTVVWGEGDSPLETTPAPNPKQRSSEPGAHAADAAWLHHHLPPHKSASVKKRPRLPDSSSIRLCNLHSPTPTYTLTSMTA